MCPFGRRDSASILMKPRNLQSRRLRGGQFWTIPRSVGHGLGGGGASELAHVTINPGGEVLKALAIPFLCVLTLGATGAAAAESRVYTAARADIPPRIDGSLDDPAWDRVEWSGDFIQREPAEGQPPTGQTAFKILYDNRNLYIAYEAFDPEPAKIGNLLARRDNFPGDWVEINIDSYHDHRTAFSFTASVSGTQGDEFVSEDGNNWDSNWDPVWEHRTRIDDRGWTAEVRIPLSQLRYADNPEQTWGIQVQRRIYRREERSTWQAIPKNESGWVSRFGELRGIKGIKPQRQVELLPYGVAQAERYPKEPGNPFANGSSSRLSAGLDGKVGVTGDLIMDFTVNPDFGQVEADPSQVNLTAFETYFQEKRPFFIEGSNIFEFRVAPSIAYGTHTTDRLFYSRRIGRSPHYRADWYEDGYVDQPERTSILGAAKLTGKTARGLSIGILESVTARELAQVEPAAAELEVDGRHGRRDVPVEPLTNYLLGRVQRDYRRGDTRIGGLFTAVHRKLDTDELRMLHKAAYTGGLDFFHYLADRRFYLAVNLLGSRVEGSREAILATQVAPARYYQRPDSRRASVDSTRTSLSGNGGSLRFGKPRGNIEFETGAAWRSPGFELNDVGYLRNANEINQFSWVGYNMRNPFSVFNRMSINLNQWLDFEYGGANLYQAVNCNTNASFRNNWNYSASFSRENERISNYELRGGPSIRMPGVIGSDLSLNTDGRRALSGGVGVSGSRSDDDSGQSAAIQVGATWRPTNAVRLEVVPGYSHNERAMQYVTTVGVDGAARYIYGNLDQRTFDLSFRVDYSATPNLTVQYYGAPFISAGKYDSFRRITRPRARDYQDRFEMFADRARLDASTGSYLVDEDGNGATDYAFADPSFNVRDFNSNLVVRWAYSPGSSIYLVWSQTRSGFLPNGEFAVRDDMNELFDVRPHNVFLVKFNRWFNL